MNTEIENQIVEKIKSLRGGVSFVELMDAVGSGADGDLALTLEDPNTVCWTKMSRGFVEALTSLLTNEVIHAHGTVALVYALDGKIPVLPIASRPPKNGYRTPHWLPLTFNLGKKCLATNCPKRRIV